MSYTIWLDALFRLFHQCSLMMGNLNILNPELKFYHFWNMSTIHRLVLYSCFHCERHFKSCHKTLKLSAQCWNKTWWKFSVPHHWTTVIAEHTQHRYTRCQLHKSQLLVTLITLNHNDVTYWYLVVRSCIMSGLCFVQPICKLLACIFYWISCLMTYQLYIIIYESLECNSKTTFF